MLVVYMTGMRVLEADQSSFIFVCVCVCFSLLFLILSGFPQGNICLACILEWNEYQLTSFIFYCYSKLGMNVIPTPLIRYVIEDSIVGVLI